MFHTTPPKNVQPIDSVPFDSQYLSTTSAQPTIPAQHRNRFTILQWIVRTVCRRVHLDRFGSHPRDIDRRLLPAFTAAVVERSAISGELGVTDDSKVAMIAETIGIDIIDVWPVWADWKARADADAAMCSAAAHRALDRQGASSKGHKKLADARAISEALAWWPARREEIYPKRKGGRRVNGGLPLWLGSWPEKREKAAGSKKQWTYSPAELRVWKSRHGYEAETVKRYAWTKTREEFDRLVAKREAKILPAERLSGRKRSGESDYAASIRLSAEAPKTRKRAPGVTSARRAYCEAFGCSMSTALRQTTGLDAARVMARVEAKLSPQGQSDTNKVVPPDTDTSGKNHRLAHNLRMDNDLKVSGGDRPIGADDMEILHRWYEAEKGRPLSRDNIKKMRKRSKLERNISEACAWFEANGDDEDLKSAAIAWNDQARDQESARRQDDRHRKAVRSGPLAEIIPTTAELEAA